MNYFKFHVGDWTAATHALTYTERCVYLDLLVWYYQHETPLPSDVRAACRLVGIKSTPAIKAAHYVLGQFFEPTPEGWRNTRCDDEISKTRITNSGLTQSQEDRQSRYRAKQKPYITILRENGVDAAFSWGLEKLRKAAEPFMSTHDDADVSTQKTRMQSRVHYSTTPLHQEEEKEPRAVRVAGGAPAPTAPDPTPAALAVRGMRRAGLAQGSPSDPRLIAALAEGVTADSLAAVAAEAATMGKGFAWAIATARGRLSDSKQPQEATKSGRGATNSDVLRGWVLDDALSAPKAAKPIGEVIDMEGSTYDAPRRLG